VGGVADAVGFNDDFVFGHDRRFTRAGRLAPSPFSHRRATFHRQGGAVDEAGLI
jgi:hypothetical protein